LTAFVAKAALEALQAHPLLNANVDPDGRVVHQPRQHLGVAFDTPRGLLVPVLRDAGALKTGTWLQSSAVHDPTSPHRYSVPLVQ